MAKYIYEVRLKGVFVVGGEDLPSAAETVFYRIKDDADPDYLKTATLNDVAITGTDTWADWWAAQVAQIKTNEGIT